jgi:hypothetical protein
LRLPARSGVGGPAGLIHAETATLELRASEVADPRPGDQFMLGSEAFVVQGEPERLRSGSAGVDGGRAIGVGPSHCGLANNVAVAFRNPI